MVAATAAAQAKAVACAETVRLPTIESSVSNHTSNLLSSSQLSWFDHALLSTFHWFSKAVETSYDHWTIQFELRNIKNDDVIVE